MTGTARGSTPTSSSMRGIRKAVVHSIGFQIFGFVMRQSGKG